MDLGVFEGELGTPFPLLSIAKDVLAQITSLDDFDSMVQSILIRKIQFMPKVSLNGYESRPMQKAKSIRAMSSYRFLCYHVNNNLVKNPTNLRL